MFTSASRVPRPPRVDEFHERLATSGVPSLLVYIENPKANKKTPMSSIRYFE